MKWQHEPGKEMDALLLELDAEFKPLDRALVRPSLMLPHAAAGLHLATSVAADLVNS